MPGKEQAGGDIGIGYAGLDPRVLLESQPLAPYLVPLRMAVAYLPHGTHTIPIHLDRQMAPSGLQIQLPDASQIDTCYNWSILAALEEKYGARPGSIVIGYKDLPCQPGDLNPDHISYAREVQAQFIPLKQLDQTPLSEWIEHQRHRRRETAAYLGNLLARHRKQEGTPGPHTWGDIARIMKVRVSSMRHLYRPVTQKDNEWGPIGNQRLSPNEAARLARMVAEKQLEMSIHTPFTLGQLTIMTERAPFDLLSHIHALDLAKQAIPMSTTLPIKSVEFGFYGAALTRLLASFSITLTPPAFPVSMMQRHKPGYKPPKKVSAAPKMPPLSPAERTMLKQALIGKIQRSGKIDLVGLSQVMRLSVGAIQEIIERHGGDKKIHPTDIPNKEGVLTPHYLGKNALALINAVFEDETAT